jgi:hypothetical protein
VPVSITVQRLAAPGEEIVPSREPLVARDAARERDALAASAGLAGGTA